MPSLDDLFFKEGNQPFKVDGAEQWAGLLSGNVVEAFIVTPHVMGDPGTLLYKDKIGQVRRAPFAKVSTWAV